tara:strand:- start:718 stop:1122 length:405 start_codon:yes stop_codon:yes gene_type:complete
MDCYANELIADLRRDLGSYIRKIFRTYYRWIFNDNCYRPQFLISGQLEGMEAEIRMVLHNYIILHRNSIFPAIVRKHLVCIGRNVTVEDNLNLKLVDPLANNVDECNLDNIYELFDSTYEDNTKILTDICEALA